MLLLELLQGPAGMLQRCKGDSTVVAIHVQRPLLMILPRWQDRELDLRRPRRKAGCLLMLVLLLLLLLRGTAGRQHGRGNGSSMVAALVAPLLMALPWWR
jgi:hypothetical protein